MLAVREVPAGGAGVELGHLRGAFLEELSAQDLREEMVVPVPRRVRAHALDEEVLVDELLERSGAIRPRESLGQIGGQPVDDRGLEEEPPGFLRLRLQGFLYQVVDGGALVEERVHDSATLERQGEKAQPGGPALGAREQRLEEPGLQFHRERGEKLPRFVLGEGEVRGTQLDQLAVRAEDMHREVGVVTRGEDKAQMGRGRAQELLDPG